MTILVEDIITFKEEAVVVLDDPGLWDVISDPRYEPIFQALREGPMTVRVLTKKYNQLIYDFIEGRYQKRYILKDPFVNPLQYIKPPPRCYSCSYKVVDYYLEEKKLAKEKSLDLYYLIERLGFI